MRRYFYMPRRSRPGWFRMTMLRTAILIDGLMGYSLKAS